MLPHEIMQTSDTWDEFRWEDFMREQDKKAEKCMELVFRLREDPTARLPGMEGMASSWEAGEPGWMPDDGDEGEGWKPAAGIVEEDDFFICRTYGNLPVFRLSRELVLSAFQFVDSLPEEDHLDSSVVDFLSNATIAAATIAAGSGIGEDPRELGRSIACSKRALTASNLAIGALREMSGKRMIGGNVYLALMEEAVEVRNAIAIHVVDLRDRFLNAG